MSSMIIWVVWFKTFKWLILNTDALNIAIKMSFGMQSKALLGSINIAPFFYF